MATRLGSDGLALIAAGENATHALELTEKSQRVDIQSCQSLSNHGAHGPFVWVYAVRRCFSSA